MTNEYFNKLRNEKLFGKQPEKKKVHAIAKQSEKKKKEVAANRDQDELLDKFYEDARKKLTGICQCGCAHKSQKNDDTFYRHCICHIFPKAKFPTIARHPLNWVERTFWQGHHTNFDEQGMDKWPLMADWEDIKEKFYILAECLTDQERAMKFYTKLESLVYDHDHDENIAVQ